MVAAAAMFWLKERNDELPTQPETVWHVKDRLSIMIQITAQVSDSGPSMLALG